MLLLSQLAQSPLPCCLGECTFLLSVTCHSHYNSAAVLEKKLRWNLEFSRSMDSTMPYSLFRARQTREA
jgi:hypothetical protein